LSITSFRLKAEIFTTRRSRPSYLKPGGASFNVSHV
jgi:hypothetical protein